MNDDSPARILKALLGTAAMLAAHAVAGLVVLAVLSRVVPIYVKLYEGWENELPQMTQWLLGISHFMVQYWLCLFLGFLILDGAILLGCDLLLPRHRWLKTCWHTAVLLAVILFLGFAALALGMPLYRGPKKLV